MCTIAMRIDKVEKYLEYFPQTVSYVKKMLFIEYRTAVKEVSDIFDSKNSAMWQTINISLFLL